MTLETGVATSRGYCYTCPVPIEIGQEWRHERVGDSVPHAYRLVHHPECPPVPLPDITLGEHVNHILFESARTVCEYPKVLGRETVIVDYSEEICKDCMALIFNYNERIDNYELALAIPRKPVKRRPMSNSQAKTRGIMIGACAATTFWCWLYLIGQWVF